MQFFFLKFYFVILKYKVSSKIIFVLLLRTWLEDRVRPLISASEIAEFGEYRKTLATESRGFLYSLCYQASPWRLALCSGSSEGP